jgi:hypothetical protein
VARLVDVRLGNDYTVGHRSTLSDRLHWAGQARPAPA